jgi:long-chain acyl-CoA synthetase
MSKIYLTQFIERAARHEPNGEAIRFESRHSTWSSLNRATQELAGGLRDRGVAAGDRVAILALNCDRYVEVQFGCWRLSAAVVPLNTRWSAAEINYALQDSQPKVLIVDDAFAPMLTALEFDRKKTHLVFIGDGPGPDGATRYDALRQSGRVVEDLGGGGGDMAGIFYTGGTTGHPKGVMLTHTGLVATLLAASTSRSNAADKCPILCVLPMFHLAGAQLAIAAAIATVPLVMHKGFDPAAILQSIRTDRIDTLSLVPAMWRMLLTHPDAARTDFSSLKRAVPSSPAS